jgi:hypothetical protein
MITAAGGNVSGMVDATGAEWFKSSYSNGQSACVEAAFLGDGGVALRDTKDEGEGAVMVFPASGWAAFVKSAVRSELGGA